MHLLHFQIIIVFPINQKLYFGEILGGIQAAIDNGDVPEKFQNTKDISDIANVILFGGNGNESEEIVKLGMDIYYNNTRKGQILKQGNILRRALLESNSNIVPNNNDERSHTIKVNDDV